ncbi:MAG: hypothetical protein IT585_09750, partial [candidate division Zixibacteria bacterium]|nr:hypothetical protein [candidate division Zixibacteria bacterium]
MGRQTVRLDPDVHWPPMEKAFLSQNAPIKEGGVREVRTWLVSLIWMSVVTGSAMGRTADTLWMRTYVDTTISESSSGYGITVDNAGNLIVTGFPSTLAYDSAGNLKWATPVDGFRIAGDSQNNIAVTKCLGLDYDGDFLTSKLDSAGNTQWQRIYNGDADTIDSPYDICFDGEGNICVTGYTYSPANDFDFATVKYSPAGVEMWSRTVNGPFSGQDIAYAVVTDAAGNVMVSGESSGAAMTVKYSPSGDMLWLRRYTGPVGSWGADSRGMAIDGMGNIYVIGYIFWSSTNNDIVLVKYNPAGDTLWTRLYDGPANGIDFGLHVVVDKQGNIYASGTSEGINTDYDFVTMKYLSNGDRTWVARFSASSGSDWPVEVVANDYGDVFVTGSYKGDDAQQHIVTIQYFFDGTEAWHAYLDGPGSFIDVPWDVAVDLQGNPCVTGSLSDGDYGSKCVTVKYQRGAICGDASGEGAVNISDAVYLINYIFAGGPAPNPLLAGDADCTGAVSISDAVYLINYIFAGGPA